MEKKAEGVTILEAALDLARKIAEPNYLDTEGTRDLSIVMAGYAAVAQAEALTRIAEALERLSLCAVNDIVGNAVLRVGR